MTLALLCNMGNKRELTAVCSPRELARLEDPEALSQVSAGHCVFWEVVPSSGIGEDSYSFLLLFCGVF